MLRDKRERKKQKDPTAIELLQTIESYTELRSVFPLLPPFSELHGQLARISGGRLALCRESGSLWLRATYTYTEGRSIYGERYGFDALGIGSKGSISKTGNNTELCEGIVLYLLWLLVRDKAPHDSEFFGVLPQIKHELNRMRTAARAHLFPSLAEVFLESVFMLADFDAKGTHDPQLVFAASDDAAKSYPFAVSFEYERGGYFNEELSPNFYLTEGLARESSSDKSIIVLKFSDGTLINLEDLEHHPYSLLDSQLVPTRYHFCRSSVTWPVNKEKVDKLLPKDLEFFERIHKLFPRSSTKRPSLFLLSVDPDRKQRALPIEHIELFGERSSLKLFRKGRDYYARVQTRDPIGERTLIPLESQGDVWLKSSRETGHGLFILHSQKSDLVDVLTVLKASRGQQETQSVEGDADGVPVFFLRSGQEAAVKIWRLKNLVSSSEEIPADFFDDSCLQAFPHDIRASLNLDSKAESITFDLEQSDGDIPFEVFAFGEVLADLVNALTEGIGTLSEVDNKDIALQSRRDARRANDLKTLRHAGLANLLLFSVWQAKEQGQKLGQEKQKEIVEKAHELVRLFSKSARDKSAQDQEIKSLISSNLIRYLKESLKFFAEKKFVNDMYAVSSSGEVFPLSPDKTQKVVQLYLGFSQNILFCLYGDAVFSRARFPSVEFSSPKVGDSLIVERVQTTVSSPGLFSKGLRFFGLSDEEVLKIDGNELKMLGETDLHGLLELEQQNDSIDWFELNPSVFFQGKKLELSKAMDEIQVFGKQVIEYKGEFFQVPTKKLPKLKWLEFFWKKIATQNLSKSSSFSEKSGVPYVRSQVLEILAMEALGIEVKGGKEWDQIAKNYRNLAMRNGESTRQLVPLQMELRSFQKTGVGWMLDLFSLGLGGVLADDMGLGKTIQTIAFIENLRQKNELKTALIAVPSSLVYNWLREFEKFSPRTEVRIIEKASSITLEDMQTCVPGSVFLCSYGIMTRAQNVLSQASFDLIVFDEAQYLKNISSTRRKVAAELKGRCKFALTGTPMENNFSEFFSIVDLVVPGSLGPYDQFQRKYGEQTVKKALGHDGLSSSTDQKRVFKEDIQFLKEVSRPLIMRRTKQQILTELPEKTETMLPVSFEKKQQNIYRDIAIAWNDRIKDQIELKGDKAAQLQMLTALLRLRQVCSCPQAVPNVNYKAISPKVELVLDKVEDLFASNQSSLVFTNFVATLELLSNELNKRGIKALSIQGKSSQSQRRQTLETFEKSQGPQVLLMTLKTGGVGLNLTKANYVFHVEPWWNPAAENQATDRAHRMGQKRSVQVYRFVVRDSIEENIEKLKLQKNQSFSLLLDDESSEVAASEQKPNYHSSGGLTQKDFQALLGI